MVTIWASELGVAAFCNDLKKEFIKYVLTLHCIQIKVFCKHPTALHGISCFTKHPPSLVIEKVGLISLYNDHIKEIPPVLANYELHAFVPKKKRDTNSEVTEMQLCAVQQN